MKIIKAGPEFKNFIYDYIDGKLDSNYRLEDTEGNLIEQIYRYNIPYHISSVYKLIDGLNREYTDQGYFTLSNSTDHRNLRLVLVEPDDTLLLEAKKILAGISDYRLETVGGEEVTILSLEGKGKFPIVGYRGEREVPTGWTKEGHFDEATVSFSEINDLKLVKNEPKVLGYIRVYTKKQPQKIRRDVNGETYSSPLLTEEENQDVSYLGEDMIILDTITVYDKAYPFANPKK